MDIVDVMQVLGYFGVLIAGFILFFMRDKLPRICGQYTQPEWNFYLKQWYAHRIVKKIKQNQNSLLKYEKNYDNEHPKLLPSSKSSESQLIYGCDMNGNYLLLKFTRFQHRIAEVWLALRLEDGTTLTLPEHPDTRVCNATPNKFEAHGLTLENLVPYSKWRIRFSGLLRRGIRSDFSEEVNESELEYVKFNFFWNACSVPQHWPFDWSPKLMATAIALEPWRDGNWKYMLNKADSGGYDQFGALKGQVFIRKESVDFIEVLEGRDKNYMVIEMNLPGIRQRRWGPSKTSHLHRTASLFGVFQDGVVFELGAFSSKVGLSHCQFGNFRTPNGKVFSIDWTDFHLSKFGENPKDLPTKAIINLQANGRKYQLRVKFKTESVVPLMGGNPFDWIEFNVPFECKANGNKGCGMAMFWYPKRQEEFLHYRDFMRVKRVFYRHDIETQKAVIKLSEPEAQNPKVTSEQGALLAILDMVAHDRKPPKALMCQKSDHLLQSLVNPKGRQSRFRSRFSESDKRDIYKQDTEDNPFETLDVDFHPKYIECPEFKPCRGVVLYKRAFELILSENREFHDLLLSFSTTREIRSRKCILDEITKLQFPSCLTEDLLETIMETFIPQPSSIKEYYFLTTLLNGKAPFSVSTESTETILDGVKTAIATYFKNVNFDKLVRLPLEHFMPAVSIQVVRKLKVDASDDYTGTFSTLELNDDPRNFLIQYGRIEATALINNSLDLATRLNQVLVSRNYNYTSYNITDEIKRNPSDVLPEEVTLRIARLGSTLEKMMAVNLKIYWQVIDNQVHIIHASNISNNSLNAWELQNEFETAEMSFELKEAVKDFTPLTISSVVSLMCQSQQKIFNQVVTGGLYNIGKIIRRLNENTSTAVTIHRFLGVNGEEALKHLYLNVSTYRYELEPAMEFLEHAEQVCNKERLKHGRNEKQVFKEIVDILQESHVLFDYYYNLVALQRSWLYLIFKFICGTCEEMKAEHFEDFALISQYFNIRDLSAQKFVQSCKRIGDDFFQISLADMKEIEVIEMFHTIVDGNSAVHKPNTVELMANETNSLEWSKQLHFAFESYMKIKGFNLNSTFNMRFPQEKKRIEHVMNHLVSAPTKFDRFCMKLMLIRLRNVTIKLQEANSMREKFMKVVQDSYRILSMKCQTDDIYFMTQTELQLLIEKNRYEFLDRSHARHLNYTSRKVQKHQKQIIHKEVYGNSICPGNAVGFALVTDAPSQTIITKDVPPIILVTNNLRKNVGWLPYLRLFKGIVLEAEGYFDADAAICRLVGVPCVIAAKDATSMFKTGDNLLLNGTKGVVSKLMEE